MAPITRTQRMLAGLAALGLAAASAGCGSAAPSDTERVTQTIHTYLQAQTSGDAQRACAQLAPAGQRQLVAVTVKLAKGLAGQGTTCEQAASLIHAVADAKLLGALARARVANVEVNGGHASADVLDGTQVSRQRVLLEKAGASWKISEVPGLPG